MTGVPRLTGLSAPGTYRPVTVASFIKANGRADPDAVAIRYGAQKLTFGDLLARINRVGNAARADGRIGIGSTAAIVSGNLPEYFEIVLGVSDVGGAVATLNPKQTEHELAAIFEDCLPRIVFTDAAAEERVVAATRGQDIAVLTIGSSYEAWRDAASDSDPGVLVHEWETFCIPYTSGTTGRPKGVMLSHRSRAMSALSYGSIFGCFSRRDRFLVATPLYHGGGFVFPMTTMMGGGSIELMPQYNPELLLRGISKGGHTGTFVVPTQLSSMLELEARVLEANREHGLKTMLCNAAPLPDSTKHASLDFFGDDVLFESYGSTEAGVVSVLYPEQMREKHNCVGRPAPGQIVKLVGEDGSEVKKGDIGELFSSGPTLFNGYLNKPEETLACFRDGFVSPGDLAQLDDEGFLYIVGRIKDMIISGGVNVYPRDIEQVLLTHDAIAEAAVVGVPDSHWGEAVCAYIVAGDGARPAESEIMDFCRETLSPQKRPKFVRYVDEIPKNITGKVMKKDLRELFAAESNQAGGADG